MSAALFASNAGPRARVRAWMSLLWDTRVTIAATPTPGTSSSRAMPNTLSWVATDRSAKRVMARPRRTLCAS